MDKSIAFIVEEEMLDSDKQIIFSAPQNAQLKKESALRIEENQNQQVSSTAPTSHLVKTNEVFFDTILLSSFFYFFLGI